MEVIMTGCTCPGADLRSSIQTQGDRSKDKSEGNISQNKTYLKTRSKLLMKTRAALAPV